MSNFPSPPDRFQCTLTDLHIMLLRVCVWRANWHVLTRTAVTGANEIAFTDVTVKQFLDILKIKNVIFYFLISTNLMH